MHLQRADDAYLARLQMKAEDGGFWYLHRMGIEPPNDQTPTVMDRKAQAFAVRGAWRVQCPFCGGSQYANPETQTRFLCCDCGNAAADHAWIGVEWPADLAEIEAALIARGNPQNMHWYPHEAPEHLHAENIDHGVYDLRSVPKDRRTLVKHLVEAGQEVAPLHVIAPGAIVHPDSEWMPRLHAEIVKTMGKNVSESDLERALMIHATGRR